MTAEKLLARLTKDNPHLQFTLADSGNAIGLWVPEQNRYYTIYAQLLDGGWSIFPKNGVLANGKPVYTYTQALEAR